MTSARISCCFSASGSHLALLQFDADMCHVTHASLNVVFCGLAGKTLYGTGMAN